MEGVRVRGEGVIFLVLRQHFICMLTQPTWGTFCCWQDKGGGIEESEARIIFAQVVNALTYCHKRRVAHRDLKPENVVFCIDPETDEEVVKVSTIGIDPPLVFGPRPLPQ